MPVGEGRVCWGPFKPVFPAAAAAGEEDIAHWPAAATGEAWEGIFVVLMRRGCEGCTT